MNGDVLNAVIITLVVALYVFGVVVAFVCRSLMGGFARSSDPVFVPSLLWPAYLVKAIWDGLK